MNKTIDLKIKRMRIGIPSALEVLKEESNILDAVWFDQSSSSGNWVGVVVEEEVKYGDKYLNPLRLFFLNDGVIEQDAEAFAFIEYTGDLKEVLDITEDIFVV